MTIKQQVGTVARMLLDEHTCDAMVLHCIDFRFWRALHHFVETKLGIYDFDLLSLPGGAKNFDDPTEDFMFEAAELSAVNAKRLHHIKKFVLTNHIDCGAYGGSAKHATREDEIAFHTAELKKAAKVLRKKFPTLEVIAVFVSRRDDDVDFLVIG